MNGDVDEQYVRARTALLDAAEVMRPHLDAIVLVGAQAIYLHTGDADLAVAEFTTDADFSVEPAQLGDTPLLDQLLLSSGFIQRQHPGGWLTPSGIYIDIMVPESLAGAGTRSAEMGPHGRRTGRRAAGLEGALVDRALHTIHSLDPSDDRSVTMNVAGPAALLVAKLRKLWERTTASDRVKAKDALDVVRILRAIDTDDLARDLKTLRNSTEAGAATEAAVGHLSELFGVATGAGVALALEASRLLVDPDELSLATVALTADLLDALGADG